MTLAGKRILSTTISREDGKPISVDVIEVARLRNNVYALRDLADNWKSQTSQLRSQGTDSVILERGVFTSDIAFAAGRTLLSQSPNMHVIAAQSGDEIYGVGTYKTHDHAASINLVGIEPQSIAGTPYPNKIRGVGTSIARAIGQELQSQGITHVELVPLDDEARKFWAGRGFVSHNAIMVSDRPYCLIEKCQIMDNPVMGDMFVIGSRREIQGMTLDYYKP